MNYRNKKLLALAKEAPHCFHCYDTNHGQVVACHANRQDMGKGMGLKAADVVAFLCADCHNAYDGRSRSYASWQDREYAWDSAAVKSIRWALENHPEVFSITKRG